MPVEHFYRINWMPTAVVDFSSFTSVSMTCAGALEGIDFSLPVDVLKPLVPRTTGIPEISPYPPTCLAGQGLNFSTRGTANQLNQSSGKKFRCPAVRLVLELMPLAIINSECVVQLLRQLPGLVRPCRISLDHV